MTATIERGDDTIDRLLLEKYEPIAIVGVGLRFPGGSESLDEFGEFLAEGRSGIRPIPTDRWDVDAFTPHDPDERGKIRTTGGGFLDRIDLFDPTFFNISPKEAQYIDPQQRMLLETAWQALEHANIDPTPLRRGNGGVYVGASSIDYALELDALPYAELDGHLAAGITMFPLSGRLSYFLGWRGPSVSVDTACSSSLTALHLAVQGLRRRECDIALCGGVNALHHPRIPVMFSHAQMLAPDGQCKTLDDDADGYVRAEGCGVIVLKRLSSALEDGDRVLAIVRGTAVGQDGDSAGLTVPNGPAQETVMRGALAAARLSPTDIQYVEAHGTGTPLGDPIEMSAINDVFARSHTKQAPLLVGSVKTNLGHMEPASGLVGLIKVVSGLRSATVYPHLNLHTPSGRIPWARYPIEVPTQPRPWTAPVRRALVNSFGFAGTIAAVVVEQAEETPAPRATETGDALFTVSAKSEAALRAQLAAYRQLVTDHPDVDVDRLCYTGNVGRAQFDRRVASVVRDRAELLGVLDREIDREDDRPAANLRKVGFLFTGQGSQYAGMGADLYRRFPAFAELVDECDRLFTPLIGESVRAMLCGECADPGLIDHTAFTQPALFTLEYALAGLWMSWGVRPSVVLGHSIGEVVAAAVAGLFSLPDAVTLVAARGRLMQSVTEPGGMASVAAAVDDVLPLLADHPDLALAAINAPDQCVVSGGAEALAKVVGTLRERGVRVDELAVSHAFHSPLMAETFDAFRAAIAGLTFGEPTITLVSNLTGRIARRSELADPDYWVRHIGQPVLFADGVAAAARRGRHAFVEIGPSTALTALAKRCVPAGDHLWLPSVRRRDPDGRAILRSLAELYTAGVAVSWRGFHAARRSRDTITLPGYPFQRKRYWLPVQGSARPGSPVAAAGPACHPLLGTEVPGQDGREFAATLAPGVPEYLADHVIDGSVSLPAAAYAEIALAAQDAVLGHTGWTIRDLTVHEPLHIADSGVELRTSVTADGAIEMFSVDADGARRVHATATMVPEADRRAPVFDAGEIAEVTGHDDVYTDLSSVDRRYGDAFRLIDEVRGHSGGVVTASLTCRRPATAVELVPVEILDAALQAVASVGMDGPLFVPTAVAQVRLFKKPRGGDLRVVATVRAHEPARRIADVALFEGDLPVVELTGVTLSRLPDAERRHFVHRLAWTPVAAVEAPPRDRHVVVVNGTLPGTDGLSVSTVDSVAALDSALADSSVTDVCWRWRPEAGPMSARRLRAECERNYRELRDVLATLERVPPSRAIRLWLVTDGAQLLPGDVPGDGDRLAAASLWGFGPVLANENPRYRASLIDLPSDGDPAGLLAELSNPSADEFQVAYRGGQRHVRRVAPDHVDNADAAPDFTVRPDRTYLVTGGLGGLGLVTARKLVESGARHLVLVSRRGVPTPEAVGVLDTLRDRADVSIVAADVSVDADVERLFATLRAGRYPLGGIVHAAGDIGKSLINALSWEEFDAQLRPKMYGGWLLHQASRDLPLDFFVVYSSVASVIGGMTQAHYAAASAFLNGLAEWRSGVGLPGLAVNWGAWAGVGMSARLDDVLRREIERGGIRFFSPARGLHALAELAAQSGSRVVGAYDWDRVAAAAPLPNALYAEVARPVEAQAGGIDVEALRALPKSERLVSIGAVVRDAVAAALHFDDPELVDPSTELVSFGLDSLMAMEVKNGLESAYRLVLPASLAFDHPSVRLMAEFVDSQLVSA